MKSRRQSRIGLKDLAREVGVHVSTVSRALNPESGHPVAPDLIEEIRKASKRLGYRQNIAAYSLKTNRSRTIGVVVPDITDSVFPPDHPRHRGRAGAARLCRDARQYRRQSAPPGQGAGGHARAWRRRTHPVRACCAATRWFRGWRRTCRSLPSAGAPTIRASHRWCMTRMTASGGLSRIWSRSAIATSPASQARRPCRPVSTATMLFFGIANLAGLQERPPLWSRSPRLSTKWKANVAPEELLVAGRPFSAVVCANDRLAIGAISAFRRHEIACPGRRFGDRLQRHAACRPAVAFADHRPRAALQGRSLRRPA